MVGISLSVKNSLCYKQIHCTVVPIFLVSSVDWSSQMECLAMSFFTEHIKEGWGEYPAKSLNVL